MVSGNLAYLFAAYLIIWIVLFGYMFFIHQQVSDLRAQLAAWRQRPPRLEQPDRPPA
jgi:CcmD family protein